MIKILKKNMMRFNEIKEKIILIWKIILGENDKIYFLINSNDDIKKSFQIILLSTASLIFYLILAIRIIKNSGNNFHIIEIISSISFLYFLQWLLPLMVVIAFSKILGIRDNIIQFIIVYNWGRAFIEFIHIPFLILQILFIEDYILDFITGIFIFIVAIIINYRLFKIALNKPVIYMIPFIILYGIIKIISFLFSFEIINIFKS